MDRVIHGTSRGLHQDYGWLTVTTQDTQDFGLVQTANRLSLGLADALTRNPNFESDFLQRSMLFQ